MSASIYAAGGELYKNISDALGEKYAKQAWQDAIDAERSGQDINGTWRAAELAKLEGKIQSSGSDSFWANLGNNLYNDPFAAPIEQANKIGGNTVSSLLKNPFTTAGIVVCVLALAGWFYFKKKS